MKDKKHPIAFEEGYKYLKTVKANKGPVKGMARLGLSRDTWLERNFKNCSQT
jgi:hypothetical protein